MEMQDNQDNILLLYPKLPLGGVTPTADIFLVNKQYIVYTFMHFLPEQL